MKLRGRLFVRSLLQAIPVALLIFIVGDYFRTGDMEQTLRRYVADQVASGARERCEASPSRFGRPGPPLRGDAPPNGPPDRPPVDPQGRRGGPPPGSGPYELFSYAADFSPADPNAPPFPSALRDSVAKGNDAATRFWTPEGRGVAVAVSLGGADSACTYLVARMPPRHGMLFDQLSAFALVLVVTVITGWMAMGPVVRRLRTLAESVRQSAASHYEQPVEVSRVESDEIDDLAQAFNAAGTSVRQHLLDVSAKRDALRRFVANTTHDVALPLTVLQGHLAELERTIAAHSPALPASPASPASPVLDSLREAIQEAHYMASLLRNLGAAAKLDEDEAALERHPVDLNALVERVVARHRALARAGDVLLDFAVPDPPINTSSDVTLLEQTVGNLVDNAIRYNRAGGHVAVVLDRLDRNGNASFLISVVDDGPGVADEEIERMTARRFRGSDARTRRPEGQGLGLAIVAEATERLGLRLRFKRAAEGGLAAEIAGPIA